MNGDDTEVFPKVEDAEVSSEVSTEARDHEVRAGRVRPRREP
jgi:ribosomal protein L21